MRVLACGDRNWTDKKAIYEVLDKLGVEVLITGGATGADDFAEQWAEDHQIIRFIFPAQWNKFGRSAGPIRNQQMLDQQPDQVVAFHHDLANSRGTKDMVTRARKAGVAVAVIG